VYDIEEEFSIPDSPKSKDKEALPRTRGRSSRKKMNIDRRKDVFIDLDVFPCDEEDGEGHGWTESFDDSINCKDEVLGGDCAFHTSSNPHVSVLPTCTAV
jgi:hypothetical protein